MGHLLIVAVVLLDVLAGGCGEGGLDAEATEPTGARAAYGGSEIRPFSTDGCSCFLDGVPLAEIKGWRHCCVIHDLHYWRGGLEESKHAADVSLASCVNEASSDLFIEVGTWMYYAVDIFGGPTWGPLPNIAPWRWGYGWPESSFSELAPDQIASVERELQTLRELLERGENPSELWLTPEQRQEVIGAIDAMRK